MPDSPRSGGIPKLSTASAARPEPCRSCERREIDWGGCRCQAFALTGDAARVDPAGTLSPDHHLLDVAREDADIGTTEFVYRQIGAMPAKVVG